MLKFKNKILATFITFILLIGCSSIDTTQKASSENIQRSYGASVGGPGIKVNHPIYGNDGIFAYWALGTSNLDGGGPGIADEDTASTFLSKSWNNVANAWVVMDYAKTTSATKMYDTFTPGYAHPPFHFAKAVSDKYGVPSRGIIRTTGGVTLDDFVGLGTASAHYDSLRTQTTASGLTEIDVVIIHLGDAGAEPDIDNKTYTDNLHILLRQLWAEPEIDSMRTKIIFSELTYAHGYDGTNNYQNGIISNANFIFGNPYVGTAKSKFLPNNGGGDDVHYTAKSNVKRGRERFFGALESLPKISDKIGVERVSLIQLAGDGTYIDCNDASIYSTSFQYYSLEDGLNLGKGATVGDFSLSSDGEILTIDLDDNLIEVTNADFLVQDLNNSTTTYTYFLSVRNNGFGNMEITIKRVGIASDPIDLLAVGFQNGDKAILRIEYLTKR